MRAPRVAALLLAAGESSRMTGGHKLLRPIAGQALIRLPIHAALDAGLDPILVVVGHRSADIRETLSDLPVRILDNPDYRTGLASSLQVGLRALLGDAGVDAVVVLLADEPGMSSRNISRIVQEWRDSGAETVRAQYRDRPGHPVLIARAVLDGLEEMVGDRGLQDRLFGPERQALLIPLDEDAPIDVDTEEAYLAAVARLEQ
jgi:molybdenum cofactor cytidylyltransferase